MVVRFFQKLVVAVLTFFIFSNPLVYKITTSIFGQWVAFPNGCPKTAGLILHSLVASLFAILVWPVLDVKIKLTN